MHYVIKRFSPRGEFITALEPNQARTPSFSLRVTGYGDCRNGVVHQMVRETGIRAGDVLEVWLDDGTGLGARYSGEVRVGSGESAPRSSDLNLAGLMARLGKVEVRASRIPEGTGQIDPALIARAALDACRPQLGGVISSPEGGLPSSRGDVTALTPYFAPLSAVLQGLAARIPDGVAGVDAQRRVFMHQQSSLTYEIVAGAPGITLEPRQVSAEGTCTAIRWQLGVGDDGHPITHLSRDDDLAREWGEQTSQLPVDDGVLYLRRIPPEEMTYRVTGTARSLRQGTATGSVDYGVLTDLDPGTRLEVTQARAGAPMPAIIAETRTGRRIDAVRLSVLTNAQRVVNLNDYEAIGAAARGETGLQGMYASWNGTVQVIAGGLPSPDASGNRPLATLDIASLEAFEIDRPALDRMARRRYQAPAADPVAVHVHGQWLHPRPRVQVTYPDGSLMEAKVEEVEYVSRQGWWGTVIHVAQRGDGEAEARAQAIEQRDRQAASGVQRSLGASAGLARNTV